MTTRTFIADRSIISVNPLGLATILAVSGRLTNHREFAAIVYTTQIDLVKVCYQKTYQLNQKVLEGGSSFEIEYAEYSFYMNFQIGTRAARETRLAAIADLKTHLPHALILHEERKVQIHGTPSWYGKLNSHSSVRHATH